MSADVVSLDEYLDTMLGLMRGALAEAYGKPAHLTLFVGTHLREGRMCTTLNDDELLLMLTAVCEHMALKHAKAAGSA